MDFQTIFDIKKLGDNELGHLEFIVNSPSYSQVFEPYLRRTRDSLNVLLLNPSQLRKDEHPDDFLRGGIIAVDGLLSFFKHLIEDTQMERIARTQQSLTGQEIYQQMKDEGRMQPVVGMRHDDISTDPDEDF